MRSFHRRSLPFLVAFLVAGPGGVGVLAPMSSASAHELPSLVFPQDATLTSFDSTFADPRSEGRTHEGNDLFAPKMSPVYAVLDGTVIRIRDSGRAGYHVVISHDGGWESWYMHLNDDTPGTNDGRGGDTFAFAPGLTVGATVAAGQLVGFVGDSGNAAGCSPHTHVEIHHGETAVDPYGMLRAARDRALASLEAEKVALLEHRMA